MMKTADKTERPHTTGITVTLSLSMLLASLGTSIANIALPALVQTFKAPFAQVQAVVVAYLVALTLSAAAAGRLGDRFGLKRDTYNMSRYYKVVVTEKGADMCIRWLTLKYR
jgi:MFS family permease